MFHAFFKEAEAFKGPKAKIPPPKSLTLLFIFIAAHFFLLDVGQDSVLIHCVEDDEQTRISAFIMSIVTIILDVFTLVGVVFLWVSTRRKLRLPTMAVNVRFQLRLSLTVLYAFGPMVIMHSFFLVEYNVLYGLLRLDPTITLRKSKMWQGILTLTPLYTVLSPIMVRYFLRRSKERQGKF
ncbi:unnamed protein product, partial [Mesorhabditis spiculigera]